MAANAGVLLVANSEADTVSAERRDVRCVPVPSHPPSSASAQPSSLRRTQEAVRCRFSRIAITLSVGGELTLQHKMVPVGRTRTSILLLGNRGCRRSARATGTSKVGAGLSRDDDEMLDSFQSRARRRAISRAWRPGAPVCGSVDLPPRSVRLAPYGSCLMISRSSVRL